MYLQASYQHAAGLYDLCRSPLTVASLYRVHFVQRHYHLPAVRRLVLTCLSHHHLAIVRAE